MYASARGCIYIYVCLDACAFVGESVCDIRVRDEMRTFANDPDAMVLGELHFEWDDPRMNDVLGSEGVIDDKHVAGE